MARNNATGLQRSTQMLSDAPVRPSAPRRAPGYRIQYAQPLATEIVVDQEQSMELVKTVISAAISNITWIRDVFPNECYESRVYDFSDPDPTYEAFMSGRKPFTVEKNPNLAYWRVLVRGRDPGVDKFLDWLEIGVSDALKCKYLSTLQLSFYDNEIAPSALIEAYVVSITYDNGVPSMKLDSQSRTRTKNIASTLLLSDAKLGIRTLINGIIVSAQDLPGELPSNRIADMHLTYNDTCPEDYNPPCFRPCSDPNLIVNDKLTPRCDSLSTGHHGIQVRLFSKCPPEDESIIEEVDTSDPCPSDDHNRSPHAGVLPKATQRPELSTPKSRTNTAENLPITQVTHIICEDDGHISQSVSTGCSQDAGYVAQQYSQAVKLRIERARQQRDSPLISNHQSGLGRSQDVEQDILCECGAFTPNDILLQCSICNKFQHMHCYGYLNKPSTIEFVCYTCLLEGENILISEMKTLCAKRRTICHLRGRAPISGNELARYLKGGEARAKNILEQLERDDIVKRSQRRKKGGKFGEWVFALIDNEARLQRDYFCPNLNIAHHLALAEASGAGSRRPTHTPSEHQPAPATDLTPSPPSLNPSIARGGNEQRQRLPTSFLDGSSTQGSPTPSVSLDDDAPSVRTPQEGGSRGGMKRAGGTGLDGPSRKRLKVSSARSPWLFGRVADKASLSGHRG